VANSYLFEDEMRRRQREAQILQALGPRIVKSQARQRADQLHQEFLAATAAPSRPPPAQAMPEPGSLAWRREQQIGVPAVPYAAMPWSPEVSEATGRLAGEFYRQNRGWSEEQAIEAAGDIMHPGRGILDPYAWGIAAMPMAAARGMMGQAVRPELAALRGTLPKLPFIGKKAPEPRPQLPAGARRLLIEEKAITPPKPVAAPPIAAPPKPPTPPKPPVAAAAAETPEVKLVRFIQDVKKLLPERKEVLHAHRQAQAGKLKPIWDAVREGKVDPETGRKLHFASLRGEVEFPELRVLAEQFGPDDWAELQMSIANRAEGAGLGHFELGRAQAALEKLRTTGQLAENEVTLISKIFGPEVGAELKAMTPLDRRILGEFWEILGIPRAVQASFDISFPFRQGIMAAPRHPGAAAQMTKTSLLAFKDGQYAANVQKAIMTAQARGTIPKTLDIVEYGAGAPFARRADVFISKYATKVPGIKHAERSFAVGGNKYRHDLSLDYIRRWSKHTGRQLTEKEMGDIGHVVNYLTGRGPVPPNMSYTLSQILYSPRFLTSGPAFLAKMLDPRTSMYLRYMMAQELVSFVGAGAGLLATLSAAGVASTELNPLSSDWGKIIIGDKMRFDIWGGKQQIARYTAQLIMGERKSIGTGEIMDAARKDIVGRFAMSKLSPQAGFAVDVWRGESYMGEEISAEPGVAKTQAWNRLAPLAAQDIVEAVREEGAKGIIATPAFFGIGVMTFETPGQKVAKIAREETGREWQELGSIERQRLEAQHPELAAARQEQLEAAAKWGSQDALELQKEDADFEAKFKDYLQQPGVTYQQAINQYKDYITERAIRNELRWRDSPEHDPRSALERKMDQYDALEFPEWGTAEEKELWYQQRAALIADPDVDAGVRDRQKLRFKDESVQGFIDRYQDALSVQREYYSIPAYVGLSPSEGRLVSAILAEAQAMVMYGMALDMKTAILIIGSRGQYEPKLLLYAASADRFRNPARQQFRMSHPELAMFEEIPVDRAALTV